MPILTQVLILLILSDIWMHTPTSSVIWGNFPEKLRKCFVSDFNEWMLINMLHSRGRTKIEVPHKPICCCRATDYRSNRERCASAAASAYANESFIGGSYRPSEFREHRRLPSAYICIAAAAAMIKGIRQGHNLASLTQFIQLNLLCFAKIKNKNKHHSSVDRIRQNSAGSFGSTSKTNRSDEQLDSSLLFDRVWSELQPQKQQHAVNLRLPAESIKVCS